MKVGELARIEELTRSAVLDEDRAITATRGGAIVALMRESQQMLTLIKYCGYYMLLLTLIYLGQTIYQLRKLDASDFIGMFVSHPYDYEVFLYS